MTFYQVNKYRATIVPVEVVSETECFIVLKADGWLKLFNQEEPDAKA